jgi:hypothetical protein
MKPRGRVPPSSAPYYARTAETMAILRELIQKIANRLEIDAKMNGLA